MTWYLELTYNCPLGDRDSIDGIDQLIEETLDQEYDVGSLFGDSRNLTFVFSTKEDAETAAEKVKHLFKEHGIQDRLRATYVYKKVYKEKG